MKYDFLVPASLELQEAVDYYNQRQEGLGNEFAIEVYQSIQRILSHPDLWQKLSSRTRRCMTSRFPYGIVYQKRKDLVLIVAIGHLHRRPYYWRGRLKNIGS